MKDKTFDQVSREMSNKMYMGLMTYMIWVYSWTEKKCSKTGKTVSSNIIISGMMTFE